MAKSTEVQPHEYRTTSEPWQSWGSAARYLVVRFAEAVPSGVLVWLAYVHH